MSAAKFGVSRFMVLRSRMYEVMRARSSQEPAWHHTAHLRAAEANFAAALQGQFMSAR